MTAAAALSAGAVKVDATLLIDGIPVLFGTRPGLIHPLDNVTNPPAGGLTSVDAIDVGSLNLGEVRFDYNKRMAPPTTGSGEIIIRPLYQRWFELRTEPVARLTSQIDETETSITPNRDVFAVNDVVYCQREAMLVTTHAGGVLTVTRNYCALPSNKPATHNASSELRNVPRHLYGRAAELRIWPSLDPADSFVLRYLILAASPRHQKREGVWAFDFDDNMRRFDKKVATGFRGSDIQSIVMTTVGTGVDAVAAVAIEPKDNRREFIRDADNDGSIAVAINGNGFIADILSHNPNPVVTNPLGFTSTPGFQGSGNVLYVAPPAGDSNQQQPWTMRRCYKFTGSPMQCMLQVILSDTGALQNHATWDTLFGLSSTATTTAGRLAAGDPECRFGAAIPAALVNIPADDDPIVTEIVQGFCFILMDEMNLMEVIFECCAAQNLIAYIDENQLLSFKKMDAGYADEVVTATLSATNVLHDETTPTSVDDESEVIHTAQIQCNWNAFRKEFLGTVVAKDFDLAETYRDAGGTSGIGTLMLARKGLLTSLPGQRIEDITYGVVADASDLQTILQAMDRELVRRRSIRKYEVALPAKMLTLRIADRAVLTWEHFIDFAGNTLSAFTGDIMAIRPDLQKGQVIVEIHEVIAAKLIAPTGQLAKWIAGAPAEADLLTGSKWGGGLIPADYFSVGDVVRILDASSSPQYSTISGALTVTSKNSTTVFVSGVVGFVPAAGDLLVLGGYDEAAGTVANVAQAQNQHQYLFMADSNGTLGASNAAADRWG